MRKVCAIGLAVLALVAPSPAAADEAPTSARRSVGGRAPRPEAERGGGEGLFAANPSPAALSRPGRGPIVPALEPPVESAPDGTRGEDPSRLILGRTAVPLPGGTARWAMSDLVVNDFAYAATDDLEIGARALTPIAYLGLLPSIRFHRRYSSHLHGSLQLCAGVLWPYVEPEFLESIFTGRLLAGGFEPSLTYVTDRLTLTASVEVLAVRYGEREFAYPIRDGKVQKLSRVGFVNHLAAIPMVGFDWAATRWLRVRGELHLPFGTIGRPGDLALGGYGIRLAGREAYFDLGFLVPISKGTDGLLAVMPLGVPVLTSGFTW